MYLFDFGTNGLMPVTDIPHVADYFTVDQEDKIAKAIRKIHDIISERKRLLSQERVVNIEQYNKETGNSIPNIFLIIDNYDTVKESPFMEEYEEMMSKVTREGLALGVYIILSGSRSSAIKSAIFTNIKTRVALYLFENNELTNIIGSYKKGVKDVKGRAAINDDNFTQFQIAQPFELAEGQTYNERIKNEVAQMKEFYVGDYPKHIPMMPDKVLMEDIREAYDLEKIIHEEHKLPLGLDFEDVELVSLDLISPSILTARTPNDLEIVNNRVLDGMSKLKESVTTILVDADENMSDKSSIVNLYYASSEDLQLIKQGFIVEIKKRLNSERSKESVKIVFINNLKAFISITGLNEKDIRYILSEGPKVNVYTIISSMYNDILGTFDRESKLARQIINQAVIVTRLYDQEFLQAKITNREPLLKPYEMYYFNKNEHIKIKLIQ